MAPRDCPSGFVNIGLEGLDASQPQRRAALAHGYANRQAGRELLQRSFLLHAAPDLRGGVGHCYRFVVKEIPAHRRKRVFMVSPTGRQCEALSRADGDRPAGCGKVDISTDGHANRAEESSQSVGKKTVDRAHRASNSAPSLSTKRTRRRWFSADARCVVPTAETESGQHDAVQ